MENSLTGTWLRLLCAIRFLFASDHEMIIVIVLRLRGNAVFNGNATNMNIYDPKLMRQTIYKLKNIINC